MNAWYILYALMSLLVLEGVRRFFAGNVNAGKPKPIFSQRACFFMATVLVLMICAAGCARTIDVSVNQDKLKSRDSSKFEVHFIDVGQGDSILLINGKHAMLVDAGGNQAAMPLIEYLGSQGINRLDYIIGTHPFADHIGAMDTIVRNIKANRILLPFETHKSKDNKNLLATLVSMRISALKPEPGKTYNLGDASFTIFAPNSEGYDNIADCSIVIKVVFGSTSFLLMGDAGEISEKEIMLKDFDLSSDILKIGRHGSSSATSTAFLDKVQPEYAVISVGSENRFNYPHKNTLEKLQEKGITVYRTDENGTVVAISDGKNIVFNIEPGSYRSPEEILSGDIVFITENGSKFHRQGCSFLDESCVQISREKALECAYEPCMLCKP